MRIAIQGCAHGDLDNIYEAISYIEQRENYKIDLLLNCGDFQAVRNLEDLASLQCPTKYKEMNSFYRYYSKKVKTPTPTIFIGGNHEAANHLWELYYGGWAAPNIYYLGHSGVIKFGGYRIAGLSGIYNQSHYNTGYYENYELLKFNEGERRSAYHTRQFEVWKLLQLKSPVDIILSHDWPAQIVQYGDKERLFRKKPYFRDDVSKGQLGNPHSFSLVHSLEPSYWFSAHLHCKYIAVYSLDQTYEKVTKFLALDKCLPHRDFLQIIEVPDIGEKVFEYDLEWLSVIKSSHSLLSLSKSPPSLPTTLTITQSEEWIKQRLIERNGNTKVPNNFLITALPYGQPPNIQLEGDKNHQKIYLLNLLGLEVDSKFAPPAPVRPQQKQFSKNFGSQSSSSSPSPSSLSSSTSLTPKTVNPEELSLEDNETENETENENENENENEKESNNNGQEKEDDDLKEIQTAATTDLSPSSYHKSDESPPSKKRVVQLE